MGDQDERAGEVVDAPAPAARSAARSRWLVGSSSTSRFTPRAWSTARVARVRSPGESEPAGRHLVGAQAELGEQRAGLGPRREAGGRRGTPRAAWSRRRTPSRAWSISPTTTPGPTQRTPAARGSRPSSAPSSVDLPEPLAPDHRQAVAPADLQRHGAERKPALAVAAGRSTTRLASRATTSPLRPASAMLSRRSQPSQGLSTAVEPRQRPLGGPRLGRQVLGVWIVAVADELVGLAGALAAR